LKAVPGLEWSMVPFLPLLARMKVLLPLMVALAGRVAASNPGPL
jgi:hypothetical protein